MSTKKILVPVTLSDGSAAAVVVALRLAQDLGATLVLLHVVKPGDRQAKEFMATRKLRQLAAKWCGLVPVELEVGVGRAMEVIVQRAAERQVDAMVMTTHGYRGRLAWLHRQTARGVIRQVGCPVWLVSPSAEEASVNLSVVTPSSMINFSEAWRPAVSNTLPSLLLTISTPAQSPH